MTDSPVNPTPPSFSIFRLLLAVAVFGVGVTFFKTLGSASILIGLFVSVAIAGIVLFAGKQDVGLIFWSIIWSAFGMIVGLYFCPLGDPSARSNYHPGDEFRYMIFGAIAGWLFGIVVTHRHSIIS